MSIEQGMSSALLAALNGGPKGTGSRLLCLLPNLDGMPLLKDVSGPLWAPFSVVGGSKGQRSFANIFGETPQQTAISEMVNWNCDVQQTSFVAPPTPSGGGGGGMEVG